MQGCKFSGNCLNPVSWSPNSCTFIYFQPILEDFNPDSHTFQDFQAFSFRSAYVPAYVHIPYWLGANIRVLWLVTNCTDFGKLWDLDNWKFVVCCSPPSRFIMGYVQTVCCCNVMKLRIQENKNNLPRLLFWYIEDPTSIATL